MWLNYGLSVSLPTIQYNPIKKKEMLGEEIKRDFDVNAR